MKYGPDRRVRQRPEYQTIQRTGRRVPTAHFVLIVAKGPEQDRACRLGITASRKVGNSVRRSRLKRLVRAAFQASGGLLPDGYDLVVICKKDDPALSLSEVLRQWEEAKKRLERATKSLRDPHFRETSPRSLRSTS